MEHMVAEQLEWVTKALSEEVTRAKSVYGFGNYLGRDDARKRIHFCARLLDEVAKHV